MSHPEIELAQNSPARLLADQQAVETACTEHNVESGALGPLTRDLAITSLKTRLRGLMDELKQLIGRQDARWRDFGFNIPAEPSTPTAPANVAAQALGPGQLVVTCDTVPFADRYRVWKQGADSKLPPVVAGTSQEPMFLLKDLPGGERLKFYASAVNSAGAEGALSEAVEAQVPASAAAA